MRMGSQVSMKKRILIAVLAIAAMHAAFYAIPRWWYSRPRVYPQAYEKAMGVLKEQFGEQAVEKGMAAIPRDKLAVPYEGRLVLVNETYDGNYQTLLYLRASGGESCLFHKDADHGVEAGRLSWERAREAWAEIAYIERLITHVPASIGAETPYAGSGSTDFTWPHRRDVTWVTPYRRDSFGFLTDSITPFARAAAWERLVDDARTSGELTAVTDCRPLMPAMSEMLGRSRPPASAFDTITLNMLLPTFAEHAGRRELSFLRRFFFPAPDPLALLRRLPLVGAFIKPRPQKPDKSPWPVVEGYVWVIENLDGKSESEQVAALSAKANAALSTWQEDREWPAVWDTFQKRWPKQCAQYLAGNYGKVNSYIRNAPVVSEDLVATGGQLARIVADDSSSRLQVFANIVLFEETGNRVYIDRAQDIVVATNFAQEGSASRKLEDLVSFWERRRNAFDMEAFARRVLAKPAEEFYSAYWTISRLGRIDDEGCTRALLDAALDPEKVLSKSLSPDNRKYMRHCALDSLNPRRTREHEDELITYLDRELSEDARFLCLDRNRPKDDWYMISTAEYTLLRAGGPKGRAFLERLLASIEARSAFPGKRAESMEKEIDALHWFFTLQRRAKAAGINENNIRLSPEELMRAGHQWLGDEDLKMFFTNEMDSDQHNLWNAMGLVCPRVE